MYVTGTGMVCSVGLNAASACAAMRAGISGFTELPYLDNQGKPIVGAIVPGLPDNLKREERLVELLALALLDCLKTSPPEPLESIPLLVGLAEPDRPGGGASLTKSIVARMQERLGMRFHPSLSRAIPKGHTAGFEALRIARDVFNQRGAAACLVCGMDSYISATSLLWLEQHWRLKTEDNSDGVIPGEAAAAMIIQSQIREQNNADLGIVGLGFATENAGVLTDEPILGLGLADAARAALKEARRGMHEIDSRVSDVSGESYGFKEQALSLARVMRERREDLPLWHSADSIGETGAATGIVQVVNCSWKFRRHHFPDAYTICFTSAVPGERAVSVLQNCAKSRML